MAGILPTRGLPTLLAFLLLAISSTTSALNIAYCSSENTGSDFAGVTNHYQSNGACFDTCNGQYAFAILQGSECWCSDYVPADTTSTGSCNEPCPGYPSDLCGSSSGGLFGYIALSMSPSGTAGGSTSSTSSSAPSSALSLVSQVVSSHFLEATSTTSSLAPTSSSAPSPTITTTLMQPISSSSVGTSTHVLLISSATSSFTSPTSTSSSTTLVSSIVTLLTLSSQSPSATPSPVTVLETVTASPSVRISSVYITPSTTANVQTSQAPSSSSSSLPTPSSSPTTHSTSFIPLPSTLTPSSTSTWTPTPVTSVITVTGQVKTLTITPTEPALATGAPTVQRKSSGGLFSDTGKVVGLFIGIALIILIAAGLAIWLCVRRRRRNGEAATIASNAGNETPQRRPSRLSQMGLLGRTAGEKSLPAIQTSGWGPGISGDKSPDDTITPADGRRGSYPRIVDQRLDPVTVWNPLHDNGSHVSVRSFRDDQDYSRRMLRVANPDQ